MFFGKTPVVGEDVGKWAIKNATLGMWDWREHGQKGPQIGLNGGE